MWNWLAELWPPKLISPEKRDLAFLVSGGFLTVFYILALVSFKFLRFDGPMYWICSLTAFPFYGLARVLFCIFLPAALLTGLSPFVPKAYRYAAVDWLAVVLAGLQVVYWGVRAISALFLCIIASPMTLIAFDSRSANGFVLIAMTLVVVTLVVGLQLAMAASAALQGSFLWEDIQEQRAGGLHDGGAWSLLKPYDNV
ncbi:hypothetical protein HYH03_003477 [Edaphochlamys debaryana]|uniref:Uncharacterized protein n=1 Tax=Edaphochlamys debaryana TaxID=47281 RepID=A0A835Y9E4_9CHLO|nr:hypothetical protein HYH03_003477 [Edaphochlamys debaryana]|eukprot:KAG2498737.1 hypothetical protein HYH03_003477 [Edaphochlamys debaryana]